MISNNVPQAPRGEQPEMRRNAWALEVTAEGVDVYAGAAVETGDGFIAEGAWAGEFTLEGFVNSSFRCGSGAVIATDEVTLCAPTHSVEPVYGYTSGHRMLASNSLHLIVALDREAEPPNIGKARVAARTLKAGRSDYERILYETGAGVMRRFAFGTVRFDRATLQFSEDHPRSHISFEDYLEYSDGLVETLDSLATNARDSRRTVPYGAIVTTVSSGYDSAACAALAKRLGAREAVTLTAGRGNISDSGKPVADALGLTCHEYERFGADLTVQDGNSEYAHYLDAAHLTAEHTDFLATINTTEDLFFSAFAPHLEGAIVLTGFHGDKAWDMNCSSGADITRGDNSGTGLDEFRKRIGFVNVPVPYIGVENHADLARISNSEEMAAYRVGGRYDRPLPRRIAEDAGVPRGTFGIKKSMGSILLKNTKVRRDAAFRELVVEYRSATNHVSRRLAT